MMNIFYENSIFFLEIILIVVILEYLTHLFIDWEMVKVYLMPSNRKK